MINYHGKKFRTIHNSTNGEVSPDTFFYYSQIGDIITATYSGGAITQGNLLGKLNPDGTIDLHYQHINNLGEFRYGKCKSTPEILANGKIILHESWEWLCPDYSKGSSTIQEE